MGGYFTAKPSPASAGPFPSPGPAGEHADQGGAAEDDAVGGPARQKGDQQAEDGRGLQEDEAEERSPLVGAEDGLAVDGQGGVLAPARTLAQGRGEAPACPVSGRMHTLK